MARGWESKSIEEQQSEAADDRRPSKPKMTAEQIARQQQLDGLQLSRQRVLQQLSAACNPHHRQILERALSDLNRQIQALDST